MTDRERTTESYPAVDRPGGHLPDRTGHSGLFGFFATLLIGCLLGYMLFFAPTAYVTYKPGSADEVSGMVRVAEGYDEQAGALMLTTVRMNQANWLSYVYALIHPHVDLRKKAEVYSDQSPSEYSQRQVVMMMTSQSNAMRAAYEKAGIPYEIASEGVMVMQAMEGMPAAAVLAPGDRIIRIGGSPVASVDDLHGFLRGRQGGDEVEIVFTRRGAERTAQLALAELPGEEGEGPRYGLGVTIAGMLAVRAKDAGYQVSVDAGNIGGPSAGLIFALQIYNKLVPEDITKGYQIAGTGTIAPEGRVGPISGVGYKIIAADKAGADIFFVPQDEGPYTNAAEAIEQAKRIGTQMQVVPVADIEEALAFLRKLPAKG